MSIAAGRNVPQERIAREHLLLRKHAPNFSIVGRDMTHYIGFIPGLGIYEGGVFPVELEMSENYPYDPPIVTMWSKIWHPNIKSKNPPLITHWVGGIRGEGGWSSVNLGGERPRIAVGECGSSLGRYNWSEDYGYDFPILEGLSGSKIAE